MYTMASHVIPLNRKGKKGLVTMHTVSYSSTQNCARPIRFEIFNHRLATHYLQHRLIYSWPCNFPWHQHAFLAHTIFHKNDLLYTWSPDPSFSFDWGMWHVRLLLHKCCTELGTPHKLAPCCLCPAGPSCPVQPVCKTPPSLEPKTIKNLVS